MENVKERLKELRKERANLAQMRDSLIQQLNDIDRTLIRVEGGEFELENLLKEPEEELPK